MYFETKRKDFVIKLEEISSISKKIIDHANNKYLLEISTPHNISKIYYDTEKELNNEYHKLKRLMII
jgi:hypothetical protein